MFDATIEIVEFGIALVAFLAMPRAFFLNAHVSADFIKNIAISKLQTFIIILRFILMLVIMSFVAYGTTKEAFAFFENKDTAKITAKKLKSLGFWTQVTRIF